MIKKRFDRIIRKMAAESNTPPEQIRMEMQQAMDEAMQNPDPIIQARWKKIPRKGKELTLEEFVEYVASQIKT